MSRVDRSGGCVLWALSAMVSTALIVRSGWYSLYFFGVLAVAFLGFTLYGRIQE